MIAVVYRSVFPDLTIETLRRVSNAHKVWEEQPGLLHMEYRSVAEFSDDPVAQRIMSLQTPEVLRNLRHG